jgi:4-hydroxythreonine-4-phosphate dehydrogenase
LGDVHGIGLEIILKTFKDQSLFNICTPILFGPHKICSDYTQAIQEKDMSFNKIKSIKEFKDNSINILEKESYDHNIALGEPSVNSAKIAFDSLENACKALEKKEIDVLVTAPIDKYQIRKSVAGFIGHTEFLENRFRGDSLMIMLSESMKIAFVTGHIALQDVSRAITKDKIIKKAQKLNESLRLDFKISNPKIAVLGLNPHSGENGMLGEEENNIISPAIDKLREDYNISVCGPFPADSFFTKEMLEAYDGILAMYHDQGLIPFKTLSFSKGVNFTAGIDIVRTSPVHGVAYDISAKNQANEKSFKCAVIAAIEIFNSRIL